MSRGSWGTCVDCVLVGVGVYAILRYGTVGLSRLTVLTVSTERLLYFLFCFVAAAAVASFSSDNRTQTAQNL